MGLLILTVGLGMSPHAFSETINRTLKGDRLPVHQPDRFGGEIEEWDDRANPDRIGVQDFDPAPRQTRRDPVRVSPQSGECPGLSREACDVFRATNEERARQGLPALRTDPACQRAAEDHARDMARRNYFSHTGADGSSLQSRYERYGRWTALGENIAMGTHMQGRGAVESWMNSPGHRRNILSSQFGALGIGIAEGSGYRYFVQCFSR